MSDNSSMRIPALLAASVFAIGAWLAASAAHAQVGSIIFVTTTSEDPRVGGCRLRDAIVAANTNLPAGGCSAGTGDDAIYFQLGAGNPQINVGDVPAPLSGTRLPAITAPVTIDGATGGATRVVLHGPGAATGVGPGLRVSATAPGTTIRNLVVNDFSIAGIQIAADNVTVTGSYIGTDASGTLAQGNQYSGIEVDSGVGVNGSSAVIGGTGPGEANTVAFNGGIGVFTTGSVQLNTTVRGNSIHDNGFGIDTQLVGSHTGSTVPPLITRTGPTITGIACNGCTVDVYADDGDEGSTWLGSTVTIGNTPVWAFDHVAPGPHTTATATSPESGTSQFSAPVTCPDTNQNGICDGVDDSDGDGVVDARDNCINVPNPDQRDTDAPDGYGNLCDGDLNNDGTVNFADLALFRQKFGTSDPDADLNGNGSVNFADLAIFRQLFGKPPGPSGLRLGCTSGAPGCGWHDGDFITYTEGDWGDIVRPTNAASLLIAGYQVAYAPFGVFEIGSEARFALFFGGAVTLNEYLPASGLPGPLDSDGVDPLQSASGNFGGNVAALKLNVDFADAGFTLGTSGLRFGDLRLCALPATPDLNGLTVRQVLAALNNALGGLLTADSYTDLDEIARELEVAFYMSSPSAYAQAHLVNGACP